MTPGQLPSIYGSLFFSLFPSIVETSKTAEHTKTIIDHILRKFLEEVIQSGVTEMGADQIWSWFIYCSQKGISFEIKFGISLSAKKITQIKLFSNNYSDAILVEQLRSIKFPDYTNYTIVNDAFQDFVTKFVSVANFAEPIRTLRINSNTKPWYWRLNCYWKLWQTL